MLLCDGAHVWIFLLRILPPTPRQSSVSTVELASTFYEHAITRLVAKQTRGNQKHCSSAAAAFSAFCVLGKRFPPPALGALLAVPWPGSRRQGRGMRWVKQAMRTLPTRPPHVQTPEPRLPRLCPPRKRVAQAIARPS